jgi:hypothetical protein
MKLLHWKSDLFLTKIEKTRDDDDEPRQVGFPTVSTASDIAKGIYGDYLASKE